MKAYLTGAAGFIGSHLADALLESGWQVIGVDNLSTGKMQNLELASQNPNFDFRKTDLRKQIPKDSLESVDAVFHLAADPEVRTGIVNPQSQYENNILCTYNVLEATRKSGVRRIYFTSSSTVYGEPSLTPTPETYTPLVPISIYGCSKLACELMTLGYAETFGLRTVVLRPANVAGSRATHGVILDFVTKLLKDPKTLEILGDGRQSKSYIDPKDVCSAILRLESAKEQLGMFEVFNIGNLGTTSFTKIADAVCKVMKLNPSYRLTGGVENGRAWKGDVRTVFLSIDKLFKLGWRPSCDSDETIAKAASYAYADLRGRRQFSSRNHVNAGVS